MLDLGTAEESTRQDGSILSCEGLVKEFGAIRAVDDVSLDINRGEWVSIVGPNGAGKTTLLNLINGFLSPDEGTIHYGGRDITDWSSAKRARHGLGRTFQGLELFDEVDVLENIQTIKSVAHRPSLLSSLLYYGPGRKSEVEIRRESEQIIDYLELWEHRHHHVESLPLGERRRVDLARSLALEPDVLLLDEVMSGLTFDEKYDMYRFLADLNEEENLTLVMIEHDLEVVTDVSDRMFVLDEGSLIASGPPDEVTDDPEVVRVYTGVE